MIILYTLQPVYHLPCLASEFMVSWTGAAPCPAMKHETTRLPVLDNYSASDGGVLAVKQASACIPTEHAAVKGTAIALA